MFSEPCVCHLKSIILPNNERRRMMKNPGKLYATWLIQTSQLILCRTHQISLGIIALFVKIYYIEPILTVVIYKYRGGCTIPLFQLTAWCEKCVAARHYADIGKQLLFTNNRNRVRGAVLGLSQDGACTDLLWKSQREYLIGRTIECYHFQTTSFLIGQYL